MVLIQQIEFLLKNIYGLDYVDHQNIRLIRHMMKLINLIVRLLNNENEKVIQVLIIVILNVLIISVAFYFYC